MNDSPERDRDLASDRLPRLPPGGSARRLGGPGRRDRRDLHGLAHPRADQRRRRGSRDSPSGRSSCFILNAALFTLVGLQLPLGARRARRVVDRRACRRSRWRSAQQSCSCASPGCSVRASGCTFGAFGADRPPCATPRRRLLGRDARRRLARRRAGDPARDRRRRSRFPDRELIIFLAFCVILITLVGQGLTLPARDPCARRRGRRARCARGGQGAQAGGDGGAGAARGAHRRGLGAARTRPSGLRGLYRLPRRAASASGFDDEADGSNEERSLSYQRLRRELLDAERDAVLGSAARRGGLGRRDESRAPRHRARGRQARLRALACRACGAPTRTATRT